MTKLPQVEFFVQTANIPGISLGTATVPTPLYYYPVPGDTIQYQSFDMSFLVDENLTNYKELHDWISGLGFPKNHTQFADLQGTGADRFPGTTSRTAATGTSIKQPLDEGGTYSDATLTVLNSKNIAKTEIRFSNVYLKVQHLPPPIIVVFRSRRASSLKPSIIAASLLQDKTAPRSCIPNALYISAYRHRVTLKSSFVSLFSSKSISNAPPCVQNFSVSRKADTSLPYSLASDDP